MRSLDWQRLGHGFQVESSKVLWLAPICAAAPDLDYGLHAYGIDYGDLWGHRGLTHSLPFAAVAGALLATWLCHRECKWLSKGWWSLCAFFFVVIASHGVLDAFTSAIVGVGFFLPFDATRYFMPWTPLPVPVLGIDHHVDSYGIQVMTQEFLYVWVPVGVMCGGVFLMRRAPSRKRLEITCQ